MNVEGKVALVTGGAHRVGRGLVLALAKAGCHVVLHYNSSAQAAEQTAQEAASYGVEVLVQQADLGEPTQLDELMKVSVRAGLGPVQILVNSAAIFPEDTLQDLTMEQWNKTLHINLTSPVFLAQAFVHSLSKECKGIIINITDWRVNRPYTNRMSYMVAKGALDSFTLTAAAELAPQVRVNGIALGAMLAPPDRDASYLAALAAQLPLQRGGGIEPIVQAMYYLLQNDFVTGELIRIDGGAHLK